MKLIVGLGNPGEKYHNTRHNLGFMILDRFLEDTQSVDKTIWQDEKQFKSQITLIPWRSKNGEEEKVLLVKPQTFMNNSGIAVQLLMQFYKVAPGDVWIVYDELDLPIGSMKIRFGGAAAGHHGVEGIIAKIGTDKFWRFRMGIGETKQHIPRSADADDGHGKTLAKHRIRDASDFVLSNFDKTQETEVKKLLKEGSKALKEALEHGIESSQNRFNTK